MGVMMGTPLAFRPSALPHLYTDPTVSYLVTLQPNYALLLLMYVRIHTRRYDGYVCMWVCTCADIYSYVYICVGVYVCMYVYVPPPCWGANKLLKLSTLLSALREGLDKQIWL